MKVLAWPSKNDLNPYVELTYCMFKPPAASVTNFRFSAWRNSADIFHIHWPEAIFWGKSRLPFVAIFRALSVLAVATRVRTNGGIVALTLHNLSPHQRLIGWQSWVWTRYQRILLTKINFFVSLSEDALALYKNENPAARKVRAVVIPHPHYRSHYQWRPSIQESRSTLGLPKHAKVVGIVGSMRSSKMIPQAVESFRSAAFTGEILFVAGSCDDKHWDEIKNAAAEDARIILCRGTLSEEALASAVSACDVILLNQSNMLNSGTALLALSFDKPLISVAAGSINELARTVGQDWLQLFDEPIDTDKLRHAMDATWVATRTAAAPLDQFCATTLSSQLLDTFQKVWHLLPQHGNTKI